MKIFHQSKVFRNSATSWVVHNGTILVALNDATLVSTISCSNACASGAFTIHSNVCSKPEWYIEITLIPFVLVSFSKEDAKARSNFLFSLLLSGHASVVWDP